MTQNDNSGSPAPTLSNYRSGGHRLFVPGLLFVLSFSLYIATLAPSLVFGDPTEYTLMPHLGAILHPPGYAFMTVLVKLWQTLIPIGTLAYRTNLLSAAAAAFAGVMVYGVVRAPTPPSAARSTLEHERAFREGAGVLAALSLYTASDVWQHALHTNAHIITAALAAISLFLLIRWRTTQSNRWLYVFGVVAGLSVTHHPLLVLGFPAYGLFILVELFRPDRSYRPVRSLALIVVCGLTGLAPWLYFPLRASVQPAIPFGPTDLNTLDGFLNLVLARGLTNVNLFHFGLAEQLHRLIVFGSLIQLQYVWPLVVLAGGGLVWLIKRDWRTGLLLGLHALINLIFILNTVQDVMAYMLVPLVSIAVLIGVGALAITQWFQTRNVFPQRTLRVWPWILLFFPIVNLLWLYPRISLRNLHAADDYVESLVTYFRGQGQRAVLLSDWEHMTPLWYHEYVDGLQLDPNDLSVVYVNKPFVDAVWENIDRGPIYLLEYNPAVVAAGFRLRAEGTFYKLEPPPATVPPTVPHPTEVRYGPVTLLGYDLLTPVARPGDTISIVLYLRAAEVSDRIIHPFAQLGDTEFRFTTDSHFLSAYWQQNEVIVERWEFALPLTSAAGDYPLTVGFSDLTTGEDFEGRQSLGSVRVTGNDRVVETGSSLVANFGQRVGVESAWAENRVGIPTRAAPWAESWVVRPGESLELRIRWRALQSMPDSYTVFLHLLTTDNGLVTSNDYTPLGGAWPTMLWFPKWLPGQTAVDPYTLVAPSEPGDYYIELGVYGLRSVQRLAAYDAEGNLAGDRFVLGGVIVQP